MAVSGPAPCQCHSSGPVLMVSPSVISSTGPPRCGTRPVRRSRAAAGRVVAVHAVRAPGSKATWKNRWADGVSGVVRCGEPAQPDGAGEPLGRPGAPGLGGLVLSISIWFRFLLAVRVPVVPGAVEQASAPRSPGRTRRGRRPRWRARSRPAARRAGPRRLRPGPARGPARAGRGLGEDGRQGARAASRTSRRRSVQLGVGQDVRVLVRRPMGQRAARRPLPRRYSAMRSTAVRRVELARRLGRSSRAVCSIAVRARSDLPRSGVHAALAGAGAAVGWPSAGARYPRSQSSSRVALHQTLGRLHPGDCTYSRYSLNGHQSSRSWPYRLVPLRR